jgi:hypothetical protein
MASVEMSAAKFEGLLHEFFAMQEVEAELTEVERHESDPRVESFSLRFLAPLPATAEQGIRRLNHPRLGDFDAFLVPIAHSDKGLVLEAVFNRMKEKD